MNQLHRLWEILVMQGPRIAWLKLINRLRRVNYNRLFRNSLHQQAQAPVLRAQILKAAALGQGPLISLVVPLFNTDPQHLAEMIASVRHQNYPRWQLCLADGSDAAHLAVGEAARAEAAQDPRISYRKLPENLGISGNTNAALDLATGDYIGLLDHDDLLAPDALAEVAVVIHRQEADLIYSDELNFVGQPDHVQLIHYKPDFAPDNLRSNNYICHFTVFAKALADQIGHFDSACDGSQDYDYILRLSEQAKKIVHIPKVLYYWRIHSQSVASNISVKPYCLDAARLALQNHLQRQGLPGSVENNSILSTYRIRYTVPAAATTKVLITLEDRNQLTRVRKILQQPAGAAVEFGLVLPEELIANPQRRQAWQNSLLDIGHACAFTYYRRGESLAAVLNREIRATACDFIALLDGAVCAVTPDWLEELLMFAQRPDVAGATGKIVHRQVIRQAGLALGIGGSLGGYHAQRVDGEPGYMARLTFANNISLTDRTASVMKRVHFIEAGGFDEAYHRDFFDLDLNLRLLQRGLTSVFTPYATFNIDDPHDLPVEILHRGLSLESADRKRFKAAWQDSLTQPDAYYNPNFNSQHARFDQR